VAPRKSIRHAFIIASTPPPRNREQRQEEVKLRWCCLGALGPSGAHSNLAWRFYHPRRSGSHGSLPHNNNTCTHSRLQQPIKWAGDWCTCQYQHPICLLLYQTVFRFITPSHPNQLCYASYTLCCLQSSRGEIPHTGSQYIKTLFVLCTSFLLINSLLLYDIQLSCSFCYFFFFFFSHPRAL
jgi:hypothetical protein